MTIQYTILVAFQISNPDVSLKNHYYHRFSGIQYSLTYSFGDDPRVMMLLVSSALISQVSTRIVITKLNGKCTSTIVHLPSPSLFKDTQLTPLAHMATDIKDVCYISLTSGKEGGPKLLLYTT